MTTLERPKCSHCRTDMHVHRSEAQDPDGNFVDVAMCPECDLKQSGNRR